MTQTSFKPGQSGNLKGRPTGSPTVMPSVRDIVTGVLQGNRAEIESRHARAQLT